jgi:hypothetical protein
MNVRLMPQVHWSAFQRLAIQGGVGLEGSGRLLFG